MKYEYNITLIILFLLFLFNNDSFVSL